MAVETGPCWYAERFSDAIMFPSYPKKDPKYKRQFLGTKLFHVSPVLQVAQLNGQLVSSFVGVPAVKNSTYKYTESEPQPLLGDINLC